LKNKKANRASDQRTSADVEAGRNVGRTGSNKTPSFICRSPKENGRCPAKTIGRETGGRRCIANQSGAAKKALSAAERNAIIRRYKEAVGGGEDSPVPAERQFVDDGSSGATRFALRRITWVTWSPSAASIASTYIHPIDSATGGVECTPIPPRSPNLS